MSTTVSRPMRTILSIALSMFMLMPVVCVQTFIGIARADVDVGFIGSAPGRYSSLEVSDLDGDGNPEIVFGNYEGHLNIVEAHGGSYREEWRSDSLGTRLWGVEVGDADNDGQDEIVTGSGEGFVYIFDAKTRKQEMWNESKGTWKSEQLVRDAHGIVIGDMNGDGKNELVIGTGYKTDNPWCYVYLFNGSKNHELLATIGPYDSRMRGMAIADIDSDGENELVFGSGVALGETAGEGYLHIYNYTNGMFNLEFNSTDLGGDPNGFAVYDIEGDGRLEIVLGNGYRYYPGHIYIFRCENSNITDNHLECGKVWVSEDVGPKAYGLAVGDVDGDNATEIVVGNQPGYLWIFDAVTHELEWKSALLGTDMFGIALNDIDHDGDVEIIATQGGYQGKADFTSAYTTPHIYIIDGRTHTIEAKLGETDYIGWGFNIAIIFLVIFLLIALNAYINARRKKPENKSGDKEGEPSSKS